eukprot:14739471-Alexandrium_andersonii.AAC.1
MLNPVCYASYQPEHWKLLEHATPGFGKLLEQAMGFPPERAATLHERSGRAARSPLAGRREAAGRVAALRAWSPA